MRMIYDHCGCDLSLDFVLDDKDQIISCTPVKAYKKCAAHAHLNNLKELNDILVKESQAKSYGVASIQSHLSKEMKMKIGNETGEEEKPKYHFDHKRRLTFSLPEKIKEHTQEIQAKVPHLKLV